MSTVQLEWNCRNVMHLQIDGDQKSVARTQAKIAHMLLFSLIKLLTYLLCSWLYPTTNVEILAHRVYIFFDPPASPPPPTGSGDDYD